MELRAIMRFLGNLKILITITEEGPAMKPVEGGLFTIIIAVTMGLLLFIPVLGECSSERFPNRPITIIIGFGAGGATDIAVRLEAKVAEKHLGVPVIIANKPGAGGIVALTELARTKPDGYTIGGIGSGNASASPLIQKVPYDPFKDFDYICGYARWVYGIYTRADSPFNSIKDVVDAARKNPGKISYGTMSIAIAVPMKLVETKEKVKMASIPFQGSQEVATALVGGHTNLSVVEPSAVAQFMENKELKVLAMVTEERVPYLPNVPTMKELGYDVDLTNWMSLLAPAGVPKERLDIISSAFKKAIQDPEVKATLEKLGLYCPHITGEEVRKNYQKMAIKWKPYIEGAMKKEPQK